MATLARSFTAPQSVFDRLIVKLSDVHRHLLQVWAKRAEEARVFNELSSLSDRDLSDLGIARAAIRDIARDAARQV